MTKWQKYRKIQNGESTGVRVCPCKYVEYIWRCLGTAKKWQKNPLWSSNYRTTYTNYRMMTTFGVSSKCRIATKKQQQHQNHAVRYSRRGRASCAVQIPEVSLNASAKARAVAWRGASQAVSINWRPQAFSSLVFLTRWTLEHLTQTWRDTCRM